MMEKKNTKQSDINRDFIRTVGCNFFLLPATLIVVSLLVILGLKLFQLYFWGDSTVRVEPFQDMSYLVWFAIVVLTLLAFFWAAWRNMKLLYSIVERYRTMRQEKARIERLIKSDEAQDNQDTALLTYAEDEAHKELANGKR